MLLGPKTTFTLQTSTATTTGTGGKTYSWANAITIQGVLTSINIEEQLDASKTTVFANHRLFVDYPIAKAQIANFNEKNRILIGSSYYQIKAVTNRHNHHLEIHLLKIT